MSWIDVMSRDAGELAVEYIPAHPSGLGTVFPPRVQVRLEGTATLSQLNLDIEHVRQLAEELPRLLMAHDVAEHAAKEHAAAVAESRAA